MNIECPRCKTMTIYKDTNPYRPFCSQRCQLHDTAAWASESYSLPADASDIIDLEELENELRRAENEKDHSK